MQNRHTLLGSTDLQNNSEKCQRKKKGMIRLMKEILHHLGCIKPCKTWDKLPINWLAGFLIPTVVQYLFVSLLFFKVKVHLHQGSSCGIIFLVHFFHPHRRVANSRKQIVFPFLTKLVAALMIQKVLSQRDQIDLHCVHGRCKM